MKKTKRLYAMLAALVFIVLVAAIYHAVSSDNKQPAPAARIALVRITNNGFEPSVISVSPGAKIIWSNDDAGLHQIVADPYPKGTGLPGLKSEILNQDQTYTYTATTVGSFGYHDQLKPTINGTLVVRKQ